jgi:cystathionine beta-synthase
VLSFVCDSGNKYLSKMYNDYWLLDQGLYKRNQFGDLRDIISRRYEDKATVIVNPQDTLNTAYCRMKLYDISQIPVLVENKVIGIVDESDLLIALHSKSHGLTSKIEEIMTKDLKKIKSSESVDSLVNILNAGLVAIVEDENGVFQGLITKIDLINYLRDGK